MTAVLGIMTVAFARQEIETLEGCSTILATLRRDIAAFAKTSDEDGRLTNWFSALRVVSQAINVAAENLHQAIQADEAR